MNRGVFIKIAVVLILVCSIKTTALSCSCFRTTFCNYINDPNFDGVIWIGEFVGSQRIVSGNFTAYEYKVIEVLRGDLMLGDSLWTHERSFFSYDNTTDAIWVFGGDQAGNLCYEDNPEGNVLFATRFRQISFNDETNYPLGYSTSLCSIDFMPISDDNEVSENIDNLKVKSTYSIDEMRTIIAEGCANLADETEELDKTDTPALNFHPNPTDRGVIISSSIFNLSQAVVTVYNILGQEISQRHSGSHLLRINLGNVNSGVYFISVEVGDRRYVKRIVKQSF